MALAGALVALSVLRISQAGFTATTDGTSDWAAGSVVLTDDDAGQVMFDSATAGLLDGGQSSARCLAVTYSGSLTTGVAVRAFATASGALAPNLDLSVEEGTGGGYGTCAGFTPASTLYSGTLAGYAAAHNDFASGASDWRPAGTETRTYRLTATVRNVPSAQASSATATFTWAATTVPPVWSPAMLSGKSLWVRGSDLGAPGSAVSSWADQSGRRTAQTLVGTAPTVDGGATPSGGKAVQFGVTNGWFALTDVLNTGSQITGTPGATGSGDERATTAMDGRSDTQWTTIGTVPAPQWLQVDPPAPAVVTTYTIEVRNGWNSRDPRTWLFQGSTDGAAWTTLDTQTGQTFTPGGSRTFSFANSTAYASYRLWVTDAAGGAGSAVHVTELTLGGQPKRVLPTAGEIWVVLRSDNTSNNGSWGSFGADTGGQSHYTWSNQIADDFGIGTRQGFVPNLSVSTWRVLRITSDGTWSLWLDGVLQKQTTAPVVWPVNYALGIGGAMYDAGGGTGFRGDIAEVLVRSQVSSAPDAAKMYAYLNAQHGLSVAP